MKNRGRVPAAHLAIVAGPVVPLVAVDRPRPPATLTDEEAQVWREVVDAMPADWFGAETHALLGFYCAHVIGGRRAAALIQAIEREQDFDVNAYDRALKIREREGRAASSLATRLRLTPQTSRATPAKRIKEPVKRPWE